MPDLLLDALDRAQRYLDTLGDRPVQPAPADVARLRELRKHFPDEPTPAADVLRLLDEVGSRATVASAGPRYFGFVTGGVLPVTLAANWLAGAWDQNAHFVVGSPTAAALEDIALGWILEALSLPSDWGGGFVTGTTMGSFASLAAARHAVLEKVGWDVESRGLFGAPPVTVVVGAEAHATLLKALAFVGFGSERVLTVPVDDQGRIRAEEIPDLTGPSILCAQAGNVNSGAFDPLPAIVQKTKASGAWLHVDGAFGLWAAASPKLRHLIEGIEGADSCATDLHKWLNVPYDNGLALFRDKAAARAALSFSAAYLPEGETRQPCDYTPESSRRARGIEAWAALSALGRSGLGELVERCCRQARRFGSALAEAGFEILNEVALNQVLVAFGDDERTRKVVEGVQREGTCWCGGTVWKGRAAMRISLSSWATTDEDVERSIDAIIKVAR